MELSAVLADEARPYFAWDRDITVGEIKHALALGTAEERLYWTARVMVDARYQDVWVLIGLHDVLAQWDALLPRLGRKRAFWEFLLQGWRGLGLIP